MLTSSTRWAALALSLGIAATVQGQELPPDLLHDRLTTGAPDDTLITDLFDSRDIALVDLDNDSHLDALVANLGQDNAIYWGNGTGEFTKQLTGDIVHDGGDSRGLAVTDIDHDGDLDIYIASSLNEHNLLYINQTVEGSPRTFIKDVLDPSVASPSHSRQAIFADVDGDGDEDLFVTNWLGMHNQLFFSQVKDQFGATPPYFVEATHAEAGDAIMDGAHSFGVDFADIDDDGDLDLFVANHSGVVGGKGVANNLYLNDGHGHFTLVTKGDTATDRGNSLAAAFGDMDGDGDVDLFVGRALGERNIMYVNNNGTLERTDMGGMTYDRGETIDADFCDVDDDGDLDLLAANRQGQPNILFFNLGKGRFSEQAFGPLTEDTGEGYAFAVGDVNGDLTTDLLVANLMQTNILYRNFGRQWRNLEGAVNGSEGLPRLSATGNLLPKEEVTFDGRNCNANAVAALIVSPTIAPIPFLGIPIIPEISPTLSNVIFVSTDALGNFSISRRIPPGMPALTQLFVQTIVLDDEGMPGTGIQAAVTNGLSAITP